MKITNLDTVVVDFYRANLIFVRLTTDEGLVGVAEATLEGQEHAVRGAVAILADAVRGKDPRRITETIYDLNRDAYWRGGPVPGTALSALEMAMWDLTARALGVPVHRMLGGQIRDRVRAHANGWFSGARSPRRVRRGRSPYRGARVPRTQMGPVRGSGTHPHAEGPPSHARTRRRRAGSSRR